MGEKWDKKLIVTVC